MNLTDLATVKDLCARHGFQLSKGFGQNFIVNPGVCPKMVESAGIDRTWGVVEIGPGRTLSGFVRKTAKQIKCYPVETAEELEAAIAALKGA